MLDMMKQTQRNRTSQKKRRLRVARYGRAQTLIDSNPALTITRIYLVRRKNVIAMNEHSTQIAGKPERFDLFDSLMEEISGDVPEGPEFVA